MDDSNLFRPGRIANLKLKNRVVMEALATGIAEPDQTVGAALLTYLLERARGGVAMIVLENTRVDDAHGVAAVRQVAVSREEHVLPLKQAVDALHAEGVKVLTQLHHPGRETFCNLNGEEPLWSSSDRSCGVCNQPTREMTTSEVEEVVAKFVAGAERSRRAGCDGVELHAAHGYLISQFLSPYTNRRTDRFGGSFEGRLRFVFEILDGIRGVCGGDFPVGIRLTVDELLPKEAGESLTLPEGVRICRALEERGVDYINVSNGIYESFNSLSEPMTYAQGCRTDRIRAVREAVKLPLIAVNMVKEPWFAEKMLADGLVDFVGLGRAVVADPDWAAKAAAGREEEINRCISCTYCFETLVSEVIAGKGPIRCAVNPRAARELSCGALVKDGGGREVLVAGGGVAGLEAARVLALRGFSPTVFEKSAKIGGQIQLADKPPRKEKIDWIVQYERKMLALAGVRIVCRTEVTPRLVDERKPYAVFVATGAVSVRPRIPGVNLPRVLTAEQLLGSKLGVRNKRVAVVGSGAAGLEMAEYLCERGNAVTLVEKLPKIGVGVYVQHYLDAMDRLSKFEVTYLPGHELLACASEGVKLRDLSSGVEEDIAADVVVLAVGVRSENALADALAGHCERIVTVGDALAPGGVASSVRSAFDAAAALK